MVPLPKYVRAVTKANGRLFYYFHRARGTPREWPAVRLPDQPLSPDFARRVEQCQRLDHGDEGFVYVDVGDRRHPLPAADQADAFWAAVDKAEDVGRRLAAGERKTFLALIAEYKNSPAYKELADSSRRDYDRYLLTIERAWGDDPVNALTPPDCQRAIDSYAETPAAARNFRAVLARLISYGVPRGYCKYNPVDDCEEPAAGGNYTPWDAWQFELFFAHVRVGLHLPAYTGLYTGQRSVDVFKMRRPAPNAAEIAVYQQKTNVFAPVQIHSEYRAIIAATATDHVMLHLREDGQPWTLAGFRTAWQREMTFTAPEGASAEDRAREAAMARLREARTVFHGLRKNSVNMLLEAGCSEAETAAIVGMSEAMVKHYSKNIQTRRLAVNAMKKLEAGWGQIRQNLFGKKASA